MLGVALTPLLDAQLQIVVVLLRKDGARRFVQLRPARRIWEHRVLDHVLVDGFDERVVGHRLDEDRTVVVSRCGCYVHLQRQPAVFLQHPVMDVLDRLEPGHLRVVDVVRLVVEDGQFIDVADDLAQVGLAVGGSANRLGAERVEKVVAQVVVFERRIGDIAEKYAMDVGEEDVAGFANGADLVLNVQGQLEVVAPVPAVVPVGGKHRIGEEDAQPVEIRPEPVEDDDVGGDNEKIARERRIRFVQPVKEAPRDEQ